MLIVFSIELGYLQNDDGITFYLFKQVMRTDQTHLKNQLFSRIQPENCIFFLYLF